MNHAINNSQGSKRPTNAAIVEAEAFMNKLISGAQENGASDIHLRTDRKVFLRLNGQMKVVDSAPVMTEAMIERLFMPLMSDNNHKTLEKTQQVDFAYGDEKTGRLRINVFNQQGRLAASMRVITDHIPLPSELGLPKQVLEILKLSQGLVVFCGATGSGKSTSMASLLNEVNKTRYQHILTIEDPVEYLFTPQKCLVSQRQVGEDVPTFAHAMKAAMREDPDIILLGEMRDPESIEAALAAAETGHLVFTTLHASNAVDAITRMVASFSGPAQATVRAKLAHTLKVVVGQRLVPKKEYQGRTVATEVMTVTPRARELMLDPNKVREIKDLVSAADRVDGMLPFDEHLLQLVRDEVIDTTVALTYASSATDLSLRLKGF